MNESTASQTSNPPQARPRRGPMRWLLLVLVGAILVNLIIVRLPNEITRWYEAAAVEAELNDNPVEAERLLTKAIEREPENSYLYHHRAHLRMVHGDPHGAYADCEEAIKRNQIKQNESNYYMLRAQVNFQLKQHSAAVDDFKTVLRLLKKKKQISIDLVSVYNHLAYTRAVGKIELDEAVRDAELALTASGKEDDFLDALVACIVGGDWQGSLKTLNDAVAIVESESKRLSDPIKNEVYELMEATFPPTGSRDVRLRTLQRKLARIDKRVETLRQFQAMENQNQTAAAPSSGQTAEGIRRFARSRLSIQGVQFRTAVLDTRGYAYFVRGDSDELALARRDLDIAVSAAEALYHFHKSARQQHMSIDLREYDRRIASEKEQVAIIRYHRALVLDAQFQTNRADEDRQRIRQLGFEPGPDLF